MGVGRLLVNAIVGPLIIYSIFLGHTLCRMYLQTAEPVKVMDFPKGTTPQARDQIIASRKPMIKDFMKLYKGQTPSDFLDRVCTEDMDFEDPWQR